MKTWLRRWGNSLAVRIPRSIVRAAELHANDKIEISVRGGQVVLTPRKTVAYSLDELLMGIDPENCPEEWDMGSAVGKEVW